MKKAYAKPKLEVTEFRFSEHIAASSCYWGGTTSYTHGYAGCKTTTTTKDGWIGSIG